MERCLRKKLGDIAVSKALDDLNSRPRFARVTSSEPSARPVCYPYLQQRLRRDWETWVTPHNFWETCNALH